MVTGGWGESFTTRMQMSGLPAEQGSMRTMAPMAERQSPKDACAGLSAGVDAVAVASRAVANWRATSWGFIITLSWMRGGASPRALLISLSSGISELVA